MRDRIEWVRRDMSAIRELQKQATMFSEREQRNIELKAIEQALREAGLARVDLEPLLPVGSTWPFLLSESDRDFLRINKISAA